MAKLTLQQRDARRKRLAVIDNRLVAIPRLSAEARQRRKALEADVFAWLRWYFGDIFTYEFTAPQREMVLAILTALQGGGDQAIAAPRGDGKTTISELYSMTSPSCLLPVVHAASMLSQQVVHRGEHV